MGCGLSLEAVLPPSSARKSGTGVAPPIATAQPGIHPSPPSSSHKADVKTAIIANQASSRESISFGAVEKTLPAIAVPHAPSDALHSVHHQPPTRHAQHCGGTNGTPSSPLPFCNESTALSDISGAELSSLSHTLLDMSSWGARGSLQQMGPKGAGGLTSNPFNKGADLELQRQQVPLTIEEDLFVYDDIIISKDEARTKHWRLAGRKPTLAMESFATLLSSGSNSSTGGAAAPSPTVPRRHSSRRGSIFFSFNDFDVCVDEMDLVPSSAATASVVEQFQRELQSADSRPTSSNGSFRVTSTVASTPNTVASYLRQRRAVAPRTSCVLKDLTCTTLLGHASRVKCIALSPSESDFASCSNEDASVTLTSLPLRGESGIFTGHQDTVINAVFSPDGKYLATTSKDRTMILWDVMTTKQLLTFDHAKVVICCAFCPDSKYLVSGGQDRICRLWDTKRGKEWLSYSQHDGIIIALAFSPDGNYICSASADKTLRVWSSTTAKTRFTLKGHVGIILACSYTSDGTRIISNDESLLRVWSMEDGSCTLSFAPVDVVGGAQRLANGSRLGWTLSCAAPGAFKKYLLVASNNRFVYVLDRDTGAEVVSYFCKAPVYSLTAGSSDLAACGDSFGNIYLLHLHRTNSLEVKPAQNNALGHFGQVA